ncbi:MAG: hypothetical protein KDM63_15985, partial [Verrucomicrobiae bacterium]|nr:hypothetical protein [Verrucomicrobiae bacterium]
RGLRSGSQPISAGMIDGYLYDDFGNGIGPDLGDTFVAGGRRSVAVDFPQEGSAYHFQKVRDHAELTIASAKPTDFSRLKALGWLLLCLLLLAAGESVWRKFSTRLRA